MNIIEIVNKLMYDEFVKVTDTRYGLKIAVYTHSSDKDITSKYPDLKVYSTNGFYTIFYHKDSSIFIQEINDQELASHETNENLEQS